MRQTRQEARGEEQAEVRSEGGRDVADDEEPGQEQQQPLVRYARSDAGQDRGADDDTQRVGGHDVARLRYGHVDPVGDLGQQSHRGELGRADAEGDDSQGQECQWHGAGEPFRDGAGRKVGMFSP